MSEISGSIKCKKCRFEPPQFVLDSIERRIREFEKLGKNGTVMFDFKPFLELEIEATIESELAFCISTANSTAKSGLRFQKALEDMNLYTLNVEKIEELLRNSGVRFYKKKALYIKDAMQKFQKLRIPDSDDARDILVREILGFGYKEASHFLRNTGRKNLAILDTHILDWLGVEKKSLSRRRYLEIEKKMQEIAGRIRKSVAELDLLIWAMKTGAVLK
ncbi:MAG: N-glycosylase/DNA lyase [Archaeoglobaceae archaeon]